MVKAVDCKSTLSRFESGRLLHFAQRAWFVTKVLSMPVRLYAVLLFRCHLDWVRAMRSWPGTAARLLDKG